MSGFHPKSLAHSTGPDSAVSTDAPNHPAEGSLTGRRRLYRAAAHASAWEDANFLVTDRDIAEAG
jgi:hypothetical protein